MDELLITAVFKREPLWNPSNDLYKNVGVLKKLWTEVAEEVNKDEKTVRTRWKNMRVYFFKELQKIEKPKSGDGASQVTTSSWAYFKQMMFLREKLSASQRDSNLSHLAISSDEQEINSPISPEPPVEFESNLDQQVFSPESTASTISFNNQKTKKKKLTSFSSQRDEQLLDLERKKVDILLKESEKEVSDEMLFFQSLLPYMEKLPLLRKLRVRSKIQDLILDELEKLDATENTKSSTDISQPHNSQASGPIYEVLRTVPSTSRPSEIFPNPYSLTSYVEEYVPDDDGIQLTCNNDNE